MSYGDGTVPVCFNADTCDPVGEGESFAEAITDAVPDKIATAIEVLIAASEFLGAEVIRLDVVIGNDLVDALYANDAWRALLKTSIAEAEALIESDARRFVPGSTASSEAEES